MLVYAGAQAGVGYLVAPIINRVLPANDGTSFRFWAGAIIVAYLAKGLGSYFSTYLMTDIGQRVVRDIRSQLFRHILNQSAAFFSRRTTGQLMSRITNDVGQVQQAVSETVGDLLREGLSVIGFAALMFYYDWKLAIMEFLGGVAIVALLWYGRQRIGEQELDQGSFLAFIFAAFMLYTPIKRLSRVNANIQQSMAAATRIFEMLDTHSEVTERPGANPLAPVLRGIEFKDVSFAYDDGAGKTVLKNVSFGARAGQVIALVGLSGAGKTTLVNLLPRFYDVTGGSIQIDGVDIRDVTLKSLRQQIGIVTQETVLFDDTIANNIAYGVPGE